MAPLAKCERCSFLSGIVRIILEAQQELLSPGSLANRSLQEGRNLEMGATTDRLVRELEESHVSDVRTRIPRHRKTLRSTLGRKSSSTRCNTVTGNTIR